MDERATRTQVLAALQHAGLHPSDAEIDALVAAYPAARAATDALYAVPGVRYEHPATSFDPRQGGTIRTACDA